MGSNMPLLFVVLGLQVPLAIASRMDQKKQNDTSVFASGGCCCGDFQWTRKYASCDKFQWQPELCQKIESGEWSHNFVRDNLRKEKCVTCSDVEIDWQCLLLQQKVPAEKDQCTGLVHTLFHSNEAYQECGSFSEFLGVFGRRSTTRISSALELDKGAVQKAEKALQKAWESAKTSVPSALAGVNPSGVQKALEDVASKAAAWDAALEMRRERVLVDWSSCIGDDKQTNWLDVLCDAYVPLCQASERPTWSMKHEGETFGCATASFDPTSVGSWHFEW